MIFEDRHDAGRQLAHSLERYRGEDAVVLALPRGGVVLGYEVSRELSLPLDIIVTRKIGHPTSSEYAIGAVDERGTNILNTEETAYIDQTWLRKEIMEQKEEAKRRSVSYRKGRPPLSLRGKVVIIVDDGIATGYTMRLAVMVARQQRPLKVIVAVPVAPREAVAELAGEADDIIVLENPETFRGAVGSHYVEFEQVDDVEVIRLIHSTLDSDE